MNLCVFCGSSPGNSPKYLDSAKKLGQMLVENNMGLVYGGASIGIMGVLADTVLSNKGEVFGVIPESIKDMEIAHKGLTRLETVGTMHERKQRMYDLSDAFLAIPGGMGTLDEFCEIVTWVQLNYHDRPCIIFNEFGFYDHFINHLNHINKEGFFSDEHLGIVQVVKTLEELQTILK